MDLDGINQRIAYWRRRRGLNQETFGELMGRTRSWVNKLETGGRQADPRISVLEQISRVLEVSLETLLSNQAHQQAAECVDEAEAGAIRAALHRYDVISGVFGIVEHPDPAAVDLVTRQAHYGWDAFQGAHYSALGRLLPTLIVDAQRTAAADGTPRAWSAASHTYQLASAVLVKFADTAAAWHAADRGVSTAERSGDPVLIASAARRLAHALTTLGQSGAALEMCLAAATRLEVDLHSAGEDGLSMLGMLYLKAAVCAADTGDGQRTAELINQAGEYARMIGHDSNAQWSGFGPTNTAIHEVSTLMQLHEGGRAVQAAARIDPHALAVLPRERRTHHLVDLAQAQLYSGQRDQALITLLEAERLASQEVHCRPRTRETIAQLATATPVPGPRLRALAERSGVVA
jgi:transcriptional regulator with XRE-family HTH domain